MDHETVEKFILSLPGAELSYPFGEGVAVYKVLSSKKSLVTDVSGVQGAGEQRTEAYRKYVKGAAQPATKQSATSSGGVPGSAREQADAIRGEGKMFALIQEGKDPVRLSLKCDPLLAQTLRAKYETVLPGYHLNKKHWNTLVLSGQLDWPEVQDLIKHSYQLVAGNS